MNILALVLANLPAILQAGADVLGFIAQIRAAATQTNQWTPAMEAQFNAAVAAANNAPEWQTDVEAAAAKAGSPVPTPVPVAGNVVPKT
jgi:hypothetical protein